MQRSPGFSAWLQKIPADCESLTVPVLQTVDILAKPLALWALPGQEYTQYFTEIQPSPAFLLI